ncbi:MAG TPA: MlaD family protein [Polyangia bacterium]|jgi:phospholipid/cholesterol/gamma-HCH transport system substrate-binding protein|nr:MlaD family protein [Polyangia bacterium]
MKGTTAGLKVGATVLLILVLGFFVFRFVAKGLGGDRGYEVWALFRDATGLVEKSRVQVAGLNIGEIAGRRLQGHEARITIRLRPDTELWSNAVIYKKSASLLGEYYLEIDPGMPYTPDPLTGKTIQNYLIKDCEKVTGNPDCKQIKNVIEAVTPSDILVQVNETLPVLRDILWNVRKLTEGPVTDLVQEVRGDIARNSQALEKLLGNVDRVVSDVGGFTHGPPSEDMRESIRNLRDITAEVRSLVASGEGGGPGGGGGGGGGGGPGQRSGAPGALRRDLDKLADSIDRLNKSLDHAEKFTGDVAEITDRVNRGEGTVGRLLNDDAIAENVSDITEDAAGFVKSLTRLQTIVGVRTEYNILARAPRTYLSLKLMPRPDKYYLIEVVDDPRGSRRYSHRFENVTGGNTTQQGNINYDVWERTSGFRFSFMFAKRIVPSFARGQFGITGRVGIKESTGGVGLDFDFWNQRLMLNVDLFDFMAARLPRLKVWAAVEVLKHFWLLGGLDDVLNREGSTLLPAEATCGPATPASFCRAGRDYFLGLQLTFTDEDLKALLTVGGSALAGAAR